MTLQRKRPGPNLLETTSELKIEAGKVSLKPKGSLGLLFKEKKI